MKLTSPYVGISSGVGPTYLDQTHDAKPQAAEGDEAAH